MELAHCLNPGYNLAQGNRPFWEDEEEPLRAL